MADLCLEQARWPELQQIIGQLRGGLQAPLEAAVLQARLQLAQKDFAAALELLRATIADHPRALWPRVILSHVLLQDHARGRRIWPPPRTRGHLGYLDPAQS
jgi:hypothetical protein